MKRSVVMALCLLCATASCGTSSDDAATADVNDAMAALAKPGEIRALLMFSREDLRQKLLLVARHSPDDAARVIASGMKDIAAGIRAPADAGDFDAVLRELGFLAELVGNGERILYAEPPSVSSAWRVLILVGRAQPAPPSRDVFSKGCGEFAMNAFAQAMDPAGTGRMAPAYLERAREAYKTYLRWYGFGGGKKPPSLNLIGR